ncbi:CapA family protein [candidate division KSB1 bacterium]|nr:CapA family protein [candidate division KSB1 bacterium]
MITLLLIVLGSVAAWGSPIIGAERDQPPPDTTAKLILVREGAGVRLMWNSAPEWDSWYVVRASEPVYEAGDTLAVVTDTTWLDSLATSYEPSHFCYWVIAAFPAPWVPDTIRVIEDFSGNMEFTSYPNQDDEPAHWAVVEDGAQDSAGSLVLFGDTWKVQAKTPFSIDRHEVWELTFKTLLRGELQAIGVADSANELWYILKGKETRYSLNYFTQYQGWFLDSVWNTVDLQIGDDWVGRFGYVPMLNRLMFANDNDTTNPRGVWMIDGLKDVTGLIPPLPEARFYWSELVTNDPDSVDVEFHPTCISTGAPITSYRWNFGDGRYSTNAVSLARFPRNARRAVVLTVEDTLLRMDWRAELIEIGADTAAREVRALFVGDVMMGRRYEDPGGIIPTYGVNAIFERVRDYLSAAEFAVCNLECPLTNETETHPTKSYTFKGRPEYVGALTYAGFDYCGLANNHNFDYLVPGMTETQHVLDSVELLSGGAALDDEHACRPVVYSHNGVTVAVLAYCNVDGTYENAQPFMGAGPSKPGFAFWDRTHIETTIPQARQRADVVVAFPHSGLEYYTAPSQLLGEDGELDDAPLSIDALIPDTSDVDLRRYAIDMGADLVINSHPHVLQGIEAYHSGFIAHSMGNFAFDQRFPETFVSIALEATLDPVDRVRRLHVKPIYIEGYIPSVASGELGRAILDYISELSRPMGTWVVREADSARAEVLPDWTAPLQIETRTDTLTLISRNGVWISAPFRLRGEGYPVDVRIADAAAMEIRAGADALLCGNMEDEGAAPWDFNDSDEDFDATTYYRGARSLRCQVSYSGPPATTRFLYHPPLYSGQAYSLTGVVRGDSMATASVGIRMYQSRTADIVETPIFGPYNGTFDWSQKWLDFASQSNAHFYDIICSASGMNGTDANFWVDDLYLVQWQNWSPQQVVVEFPSNKRFVQVRSDAAVTSVVIEYDMATTSYLP